MRGTLNVHYIHCNSGLLMYSCKCTSSILIHFDPPTRSQRFPFQMVQGFLVLQLFLLFFDALFRFYNLLLFIQVPVIVRVGISHSICCDHLFVQTICTFCCWLMQKYNRNAFHFIFAGNHSLLIATCNISQINMYYAWRGTFWYTWEFAKVRSVSRSLDAVSTTTSNAMVSL